MKFPVTILKDMKDRLGRKYNPDHFKKTEIYGTLGEYGLLDLSKISHKVSNIRVEGNNLVGVVEPLDTEMGKIFKELLKNRIHFSTSVVGLGKVDKDLVVTEFNLNSISVVKKDYHDN